jgi:glycosyltransferase involved in cell wall biosynthesis
MRGLVVTVLPHPDPARDRHGIYRRLGMFLHGLREVCETIEIVHFTHAEPTGSAASASDLSSSFWGLPVSVSMVPLDRERRSWWQAGYLPFTVRYRGDFRPYLGFAQASALRSILGTSPQLIFAHRLPAMTALLQLSSVRSPIFFDLDDIEHRVKWRAAQTATSQVVKMRKLLEVPALLAAERRSVVRATRTFVCSALDRTLLSDLHFDVSRTVVVPNGADIPTRQPGLSASRTILFLGNYNYAPNAEAAERLITRLWPLVRIGTDHSRLIIAGDHPECIPSFHGSPPDVEFTGFVKDLEPLYAQARIVCCPIRNGGGTRIKLIEAAGYGKPIIATPVAVEGLEFRHGRDVLVHDEDQKLALACVRLLQDDALAFTLAASAYQRARSLYSLSNLPGRIANELRAGLADHPEAQYSAEAESGNRSPRQYQRMVHFTTAPDTNRENS